MNDLKNFDQLLSDLSSAIETFRRNEAVKEETFRTQTNPFRKELEAVTSSLSDCKKQLQDARSELEAAQTENQRLQTTLRSVCKGLRDLLTQASEERSQ